MSDHADTIREALGIREWAASITPSSYGEKVEAEMPAAFAALAALEAELAEARRDIDDGKRRASELCVQFVLTEERCEAAEAENARLRAWLTQIELWPYNVDSDADTDLRRIKDFARRASGSEGDTA